MAITVTDRPDDFSASYNPVEYKFTSDRLPNTRTGESVDIQKIIKTPEQNVIDFDIPEQSVQITTGATLGASVRVVGQTVELTGTEDGVYDGIFTIIAITPSPQIFFLDAIPQDQSLGGTCTIFYDRFSIVSDLYLDGSFVIRDRSYITPDGDFIEDWSSILQRRLDRDLLDVGATGTTDADDSTGRFSIQYAEEFNVPVNGEPVLTTGTLVDDSDTSANVKTATNAAVPYVFMTNLTVDSTATDLSDFINDGVIPKRFQTNMPKSVTIFNNSSAQLTFALDVSAIIGTVETRVQYRNNLGGLISADIDVVAAELVDDNYNFACGTANLTLPAGTVKYEVSVIDTGGGLPVQIYETITFLLDETCNRNELRFHWVNPYGNVDSFTFIGRTDVSTEVDRFTRKRNLNSPRVIPESNIVTIQNNKVRTYTANSGGFEDKETAEWLDELFASEDIYIELDGNYYPVQILSNSTNTWNSRDSLFNVGFEWRFGFDNIARRK